MKELNEYKNEIFRRSHEKKQQIKKRRRIALGVGISLCLCCVITVASIPYLPLGMKSASAPSMEAVYDAEEPEEYSMTVNTFRVTDQTDVARVLAILQETEEKYTADKGELGKENFTADQVQSDAFRLTLQCADGSTVCYWVWGPEVYCETTGESFLLSDMQIESLNKLLMKVAERE